MEDFNPSEEELAIIDELVEEEEKLLNTTHDDLVSSIGPVKTAGILLKKPGSGLWFAEMKDKGKTVLADFGGKREPRDADAWATAVRELREEAGIDLKDHKLTSADDVIVLENSSGRHGVLFLVESHQQPKITGDKGVLRHVLVTGQIDTNTLHSRLRYATGVQGKLRALLA